MKKDDELWLKKMREMLEDYSEPSPIGGWERLQKEIAPSVNRRVILYRICAGVAAALFLAVAGVSIYLVNSPATEDFRNISDNGINITPDVIPVMPQPDNASAKIEPMKELSGKTYIARVQKEVTNIGEIVSDPNSNSDTTFVPDTPDPATDNTGQEITPDVTKETDEQKEPTTEKVQERQPVKPSGKDKLHLPIGPTKKSTSGGNWSMALSFNSGAGSSLAENNGSQPYSNIDMGQFATIGKAPSTDFLDISDKDLVFENGIPATANGTLEYEHKQPITVGLSVRKKLSGRFSLETGVNYTYLQSDVYRKSESTAKIGEQKLHYIGIPLRVNWNFLDTDRFSLYLMGGGMVEKCVYGKTLTEKNTVKDLQVSIAGGVGAQFNITRKLGIYAEPGVAYYFKDGSDTETIRKENPFNINLQAGIRLTY